MVTSLSFHPKEPLLFLATQRHVRVYDLVKCQLKRKLLTGSRWISSMLLEGSGNNIFVAGHDRTFTWLDLQLSNKPWRSVRHHTAAIRAIAIHPKLVLRTSSWQSLYFDNCSQRKVLCRRTTETVL